MAPGQRNLKGKKKEMETLTITDETLVDSLRKLEPASDPNQSLRKLLVSRARSELLKYSLISKSFEREYRKQEAT